MLCKRVFLFSFLFYAESLVSQEVYTELREEASVRTFTEVSNSIVCQCGCRFLLSVCPHVECPWGIPARRFIEEKIKQGFSAERIYHGFKKGFGPSIYKEKYAQKLLAQGQEKLIKDLSNGYGAQISARSSLFLPVLFLVMAITGGVFLVFYWFWRNQKKTKEK